MSEAIKPSAEASDPWGESYWARVDRADERVRAYAADARTEADRNAPVPTNGTQTFVAGDMPPYGMDSTGLPRESVPTRSDRPVGVDEMVPPVDTIRRVVDVIHELPLFQEPHIEPDTRG